jgi:hypothetical protein
MLLVLGARPLPSLTSLSLSLSPTTAASGYQTPTTLVQSRLAITTSTAILSHRITLVDPSHSFTPTHTPTPSTSTTLPARAHLHQSFLPAIHRETVPVNRLEDERLASRLGPCTFGVFEKLDIVVVVVIGRRHLFQP